jgi:hypothetical protein
MAASTANMVKSKSGKLYEASSPQGKMIVTAATTGKDADFDTGPSTKEDAPGTMLATLQAIYEETQESGDTLDDIEGLLDDDDNPLDDARDNLKASNKEKRKSKIVEGLKKAAGGVQAGLGKAKETLSGKIGLALLGGGLLLLNKYGDEIAGPDGWLTKFLKYMKEQLIPDIKLLYEDLQVWWDIGWKKVTGFFTFLEGIFEKIGAYMDTFDVDDVEGLSQVEVKAMMDDIGKRLFDMVVDSAGGFITGLGSALLAYAVGMPLYKAGVAIAGARIAAAVGGTAVATTAATAAGGTAVAAGTTLATKLGLAGLIAGSIIGIYNAGSKAMTAAVDEETGKLDFTKYASSFIAGDAEGGFGNAIKNAFTGGPTAVGAAIGIGLGVVGGPAGMLIGGLMGAAIGGVVGGITGLIGADNMDKFFQGTVDLAEKAVNSVVEFFGGIVAGVTSFVKGDGYTVGRNQYMAKHAGSSRERLTEIEDKQIDVDILQQEFDFEKNAKKKRAKELVLNKAKKELQRLKAKNVEVEQILTQINNEEIAEAKASLPEMYDTLRAMESGIISKGRGDNTGKNKYDKLIMKIEAAEKIITTRDDGAFRPLNDAERNELSQQAAAGPTEGAFVAKTPDQMLKINQLVAAQNAKELIIEMKADNAKENKFTTFTSDSSQTNAITNANYIAAGMSARNDFWANYDTLEAATN